MNRIGGTPGLAVLAVGALVVPLAGCTRATNELAVPPVTQVAPLLPETTDDASGTAGTGSSAASTGTGDPSPTSVSAVETTLATIVVATPVSVIDVDEVGTPGLDSDDAFCAAWSRFAGSFQVVAVMAAFGTGPPEELAALEVAASPVVTGSYDALFENWPPELSEEAELVADEFLGPFQRRLAVARASLDDVGTDVVTIDAIRDAWIDGLARRDPTTPRSSSRVDSSRSRTTRAW